MSAKSQRKQWTRDKRDRQEFLCQQFDTLLAPQRPEPWKVWEAAEQGR